MHQALQKVVNGLAYAKFSNKDVEKATQELIANIGVELEEELYEPGANVEACMSSLDDALNEADETEEAVAGVINKSRDLVPEDEDDEG